MHLLINHFVLQVFTQSWIKYWHCSSNMGFESFYGCSPRESCIWSTDKKLSSRWNAFDSYLLSISELIRAIFRQSSGYQGRALDSYLCCNPSYSSDASGLYLFRQFDQICRQKPKIRFYRLDMLLYAIL